MGNNSSRASDGDQDFVTIKRQIGKRSSVNILKWIDARSATDSRSTGFSTSVDSRGSQPLTDGSNTLPPDAVISVDGSNGDAASVCDSAASTKIEPDMHHRSLSLARTITPRHTALQIVDAEEDPATPIASRPDLTRLIPDEKETVTNTAVDGAGDVQHRRMTVGPELFHQVAERSQMLSELPRLHTIPSISAPSLLLGELPAPEIFLMSSSPPKPYRPTMATSPAIFFHQAMRKHHPRGLTLIKSTNARSGRLVQQDYPDNLCRFVSDDTETHASVALAVPLWSSQMECHGRHEEWWHDDGSELSAVECAICLGPDTGGSAGYAVWQCMYCATRVCEECKMAHTDGGSEALMERLDFYTHKGSKTE